MSWKPVQLDSKNHKQTTDAFFFSLEEIDEEELRKSISSNPTLKKSKKRKFQEFQENDFENDFENENDFDFESEKFIDFEDFDFENDCVRTSDGVKETSVVTTTGDIIDTTTGDIIDTTTGDIIDTTTVVEETKSVRTKKTKKTEKSSSEKSSSLTAESTLKPWMEFGLDQKLAACLVEELHFTDPTEIQRKSLGYTVKSIAKKNVTRDIIAASETGSGKTLAYGLPILNHILINKLSSTVENQSLTALILVPTRELAIQVQAHFIQVAAPVFGSQWAKRNVVTAVGGLSVDKQMRLLKFNPQILIATPGRLWALSQEEESVKSSLGNLAYLVIDEADRMLEPGHFKQLDDILLAIDFKSDNDDDDIAEQEKMKRSTFIYSATMVDKEDLQLNLTKSKKAPTTNPGGDKKKERNLLFRNLLKKIKFQDPNPIYINLSSEKMVASGVQELKISCTKEEKDLMLYYLLMHASSLKIIVFVNSISAIRRLVPILTFLRIPVHGLHAEMQQQQRLKSLERFKSQETAVLVCSDVAARGLDVPKVDQVIQYHLPRSADSYIHRSGRTARGNGQTGTNILLLSPPEMSLFTKLCRSLHTPDLPEYNMDAHVLSQLAPRLLLAKQLDSKSHALKKQKADADWFRKAAGDADIAYSDPEEEEEAGWTRNREAGKREKIVRQLDELLRKPVRAGKLFR